MKFLFISNFYPPLHRGGYEEWCQEIADSFIEKGHSVRVLTSTFQIDQTINDPPHVFRQLNLEMEIASLSNGIKFFTQRKPRVDQSVAHLKHHIDEFSPDCLLVWGMWNLPFEIPAAAEKAMPSRVVYYLGDYWPTLPPQFHNYWEAKPRNFLTGIPKSILAIFAKRILQREKRPKLELEQGLFCSDFLKEEIEAKGITFKESKTIYGAIDTAPYDGDDTHRAQGPTVKLLFIGRIIEDKGIKTILESLKKLSQAHQVIGVHLKIVGDGDPQYLQTLHAFVAENNLGEYVSFVGPKPKSEIPQLYQQADIFIFASKWPEPFGRVIVEAMASGCAVIGSAVGGAAEIMVDGHNALTFEAENIDQLAGCLKKLILDKDLRSQLRQNGRKDALKFDLNRMSSEILATLKEAAGR